MKITHNFLMFFLMIIFVGFNAQAEWKFETIEGVQVHYYVPKNPFKGSLRSLMVNLHGCSQKAEDLKKDGNWENTAEDFNMIVALPKVPNGGVISGCWDYYGGDHTLNNRHNAPLLKLVKALLSRIDLSIDPGQVYLSGLSSGGGETMVLGCLAPDVFAGLGVNAGPSTGTLSSEISFPKTSYQSMLDTCKKLGTGKEDFFKTQLTSIIYGNNDFIVSTKFDLFNADIMRAIYGASIQSQFDTTKLEGANKEGTGTLWSDSTGPRVSLIMNKNLGHNWPAGQGGNGGNFINKKSLNYPHYLAQFFYTNNRRSKNVVLPEVLIDPVESRGSKFFVTGTLTVSRTLVKSIEVVVLEKGIIVDRFPVNVGRDMRFSAYSRDLTEGEYTFQIEFKNFFGASRVYKRNSWLGEVGGMNFPQLVNTQFEVVNSCLMIRGIAVNNGPEKVSSVSILLDKKEYLAIVENNLWNFEICNLIEGDHSLLVYATNELGQTSNKFEAQFSSSPSTAWATLQEHMEAGRLRWEDFGVYYLRYGNQKFKIYLGRDNVWRDTENYRAPW